jgi:rod shape-determining protein MreD
MRVSKLFTSLRRDSQPRINRAPSPLIARGVPWLGVMLGTLLPTYATIASAPVLPPLAFLIFISWRQLRPGLLPIWAGLPLGFFDDLYSGQPLGSAVMLWSGAAIALDYVPGATSEPNGCWRLD